MEIKITCLYCNHTIYKAVYDMEYLQGLKCEKCGDQNLDMKDNNKGKIDTYAGTSPFKEKEELISYWDSGGD